MKFGNSQRNRLVNGCIDAAQPDELVRALAVPQRFAEYDDSFVSLWSILAPQVSEMSEFPHQISCDAPVTGKGGSSPRTRQIVLNHAGPRLTQNRRRQRSHRCLQPIEGVHGAGPLPWDQPPRTRMGGAERGGWHGVCNLFHSRTRRRLILALRRHRPSIGER